mmetsp:Transcript_53685/g.138290  ORF Transcript_53685/g.138290 Transcript_53685/m.138290 type:complete len:275 (-) Transcript_53685:1349-2173(-)
MTSMCSCFVSVWMSAGEVSWCPFKPPAWPMPSWPCTLLPKAHTCVPRRATTSECREPAAMDVIPTAWSSRSGSGTAWSSTRPRPSCPFAFAPHVKSRPSSVAARLWSSPAVSRHTRCSASSPSTGYGVSTVFGRHALAGSRWPKPSCPWLLSPTQYTLPSSVTIRLCRAPAATILMLTCVDIRSRSGPLCLTSGPCARAPRAEVPKVYTWPSVVSSSVCAWPEAATQPATCTALCARTLFTRCGALTCAISLRAPSSIERLDPNAHSCPREPTA